MLGSREEGSGIEAKNISIRNLSASVVLSILFFLCVGTCEAFQP
jgi:hypothetical protein